MLSCFDNGVAPSLCIKTTNSLQLHCDGSATARNVTFRTSLWSPTHKVNSIGKPNYLAILPPALALKFPSLENRLIFQLLAKNDDKICSGCHKIMILFAAIK